MSHLSTHVPSFLLLRTFTFFSSFFILKKKTCLDNHQKDSTEHSISSNQGKVESKKGKQKSKFRSQHRFDSIEMAKMRRPNGRCLRALAKTISRRLLLTFIFCPIIKKRLGCGKSGFGFCFKQRRQDGMVRYDVALPSLISDCLISL